jgi:uncharacterized membrane protein YoaK (UPF0700 family)
MSTTETDTAGRPWSRRAVTTAVAVHVGFVDATGFVLLGGFFVSSIAATTTQGGVALGRGTGMAVGLAGAILAGFLSGVVLAGVVAHTWPRARVPRVLLLSVGLLAAAGALHAATTSAPLIGFVLALPMGAEATLLDTGGLLAGAAQGLIDRFFDHRSRRWARYLRLWVAVAAGAIVGAVACRVFGFDALWIAAATAGTAAYVFRNIAADPAAAADPDGLEI